MIYLKNINNSSSMRNRAKLLLNLKTTFILLLLYSCTKPNYLPPPAQNYYTDKIRINPGISLSGLYLNSSVDIYEGILIIPNINLLGFDMIRVGSGLGKKFSLIEEKILSFNIIPSIFASLINYEGEENIDSPHLRGIELFPDIQLSFHTIFLEILLGFRGILIPYAKINWIDTNTNQSTEETYSNPFQIFIPSVYGGLSLGFKRVYLNGGIALLLLGEDILNRKQNQNVELIDRIDIPRGTINLGLSIFF